jgi:tetratricopeptide (TPR) repeat protein
MGEVYAAYDPTLDRRVALKLLHEHGAEASDRSQQRLWREAQAIAKLSHPNVVVVYEVGTFDDRLFIAMEYVEGVTLAAWLAERPREWREILDVFLQAARGLSAAHRAGLVHRDFKPHNVMVTPDGVARVMDFGLARRTGSEISSEDSSDVRVNGERLADRVTLTRTGEVVGTPLYMAPEQFAGRTDERTDQFSLCVSLYEALYGQHPFGGVSTAGVVNKVAKTEAAHPPAKASAPANVQRAIMRGLCVDPDDRWPTMAELIDALARDPRRRRRIAMGAVIVGVVCAGIAVIATRTVLNRDLCAGGQAQLATAWELESGRSSTPHRVALREAVDRTASSEAEALWGQLSSTLDHYATIWLASYRDACEATHVRHEQSEEGLDLRMACLNDNLESTRALVDQLPRGDVAVMRRATDVVHGLEDLSRCENVAALRNGVQPPKDPLVRDEVARLSRHLKEAEAMFELAQWHSALGVAEEVRREARRLNYCPLEAESLALLGDSLNAMWSPEAVPVLERAADMGERCHDDRVVARAATALVASAGGPAAERWSQFAAAAIERTGGEPRLRSWLLNNLGCLRFGQGRITEALDLFQRSRRLKEAIGAAPLDWSISINNVALSLRWLDRVQEGLALVRDATTGMPGTWFSDSAHLVATTGLLLAESGRFDEAERTLYLATDHGFDGTDDPDRHADILYGLAQVMIGRGESSVAISLLEKARRIREAGPASAGIFLAEVQHLLAVALDRVSPGSARARELAEKALHTYERMPDLSSRRDLIRRWLETRASRGLDSGRQGRKAIRVRTRT